MIRPDQKLENTIKIINHTMNYAGIKYWLCFGGLWGLVRNNGVIPDDDLDLCTYYGTDYKKVVKAFELCPARYKPEYIMTDCEGKKALHIGFESECGYPHICLSFWVLKNDIRYYCHNQHRDLQGTVPAGGYEFRGVPAYPVEDHEDNFRLVEWPGLHQTAKIRVPRFPGVILDHLYPDWPYKKQMYQVQIGVVNEDKMVSYHQGGAVSQYSIHINKISDFNNDSYVAEELKRAYDSWKVKIRAVK